MHTCRLSVIKFQIRTKTISHSYSVQYMKHRTYKLTAKNSVAPLTVSANPPVLVPIETKKCVLL